MKVSTEKIPEAQLLMTIEVESDRLDKAREKAIRKLSPKARVPGFRPGKAPPALVRQYFGEERILDEALDDLVPDIYREAVEADDSIEPIARPRLVVETTDPLVVKATIPIRPTVTLGDYNAVRVEQETVTIDDARVDETLLTIRRRAATLEPIERPLQWRDVVRVDIHGTVEGEEMVAQQEAEVQLIEERDVLFPGFEEQLLGKTKGEAFSFELPVPETITVEKFAGKVCLFDVTIREAKEEVLPELNEDFTKAIGEGFDSAEALRQRIHDDILSAEEEQRDNRYHDVILGKLVEEATIEYPPVMLDSEVDRLLHDQAGHNDRGEGMAQYLAAVGKTEDEVREEFRPVADMRLRRSLVLVEVAEAEHIEATPEEIDAEVEKLSSSAGAQAEQLKALFGSEEGKATIRRNLVTRKTLEKLISIATQDGSAPARGAAPAAKAAAKKKAPAKKKGAAAAKALAAEAESEAPVAE